jgi:5-methylcytosine-specific restriction endonuclease McrA
VNTVAVQTFLNETERMRIMLFPWESPAALNRRRYYELSAMEPEVVPFLHTASEENRRAEKLGLNQRVEFEEWLLLCIHYGLRCLACGEQTKLGMDHVVPYTQGGWHHISNIQPLCKDCNSAKKARTIDYR